MTIEELNSDFIKGNIDFNEINEYIIDDNKYSTYRDFNSYIDVRRAQENGFVEITYIGEKGHFNFRYRYDNGSLITVYIKRMKIWNLKQEIV